MKSIIKALKTRPIIYSSLIMLLLQCFITFTIVFIILTTDVYVGGANNDIEGTTQFLIGTVIAFILGIVVWLICLSRLRTGYIIGFNILLFILIIIAIIVLGSSGIMLPAFFGQILLFTIWQYFFVYGIGYIFYFRFHNVFLTILSYSFWFFSIIIVSISERIDHSSQLSESSIVKNFAVLWQGPEIIFVLIYLILIAILTLVDTRLNIGRWHRDLAKKIKIRKRDYGVFTLLIVFALIIVTFLAPIFWRLNWEYKYEEQRKRQEKFKEQYPNNYPSKPSDPDNGGRPDSNSEQSPQSSPQPNGPNSGSQENGGWGEGGTGGFNPGGTMPDAMQQSSQDAVLALVRYGDSINDRLEMSPDNNSLDYKPEFVSMSKDIYKENNYFDINYSFSFDDDLSNDELKFISTKEDFPMQYFRSEIYDEYSYKNYFQRNMSPDYTAIDGDEVRGFYYNQDYDKHEKSTELYQLFLIVSNETRQVLGHTDQFEFGFLSKRKAPFMYGYRNGVIVTDTKNSIRSGDTFYVLSSIPNNKKESLGKIEAPERKDFDYLQRSNYSALYDYQIKILAQKIVGNEKNYFSINQKIKNYLLKNYELDLTQSSRGDLNKNMIRNFLISEKKGSVPMFAAAYSSLLYNLDNSYVSRIVAGFRTSHFEKDVNAFVISSGDGYFWNEVYFPGIGWVTIDVLKDKIKDSHETTLTPEQKDQFDERLDQEQEDIEKREEKRDFYRDEYGGKQSPNDDSDTKEKDFNDEFNDDSDIDSQQDTKNDQKEEDNNEKKEEKEEEKEDSKTFENIVNFIKSLLNLWPLFCCLFIFLIIFTPWIIKLIRWKIGKRKAFTTQSKIMAIEGFYGVLQRFLRYFSLHQKSTETNRNYIDRLERIFQKEINSISHDNKSKIDEKLLLKAKIIKDLTQIALMHEKAHYDRKVPNISLNKMSDMISAIAKNVVNYKSWRVLKAVYLKW